jgi:hypothetical protein
MLVDCAWVGEGGRAGGGGLACSKEHSVRQHEWS